jgi:hypothetical protein
MTEAIVVDKRLFTPVRVLEEHLEDLLTTAAPSVFPGFDFFEFKPAIRCGEGLRHPDAVLLAPGSDRWWVVEVETHRHEAIDHIETQMRDLMGGFYGPDVFSYLDRHDGFDAARYPIDTYEPSFLLIIDSLTPQVHNVAVRLGLQAVECSVFIAPEANQYALALSGPRPQADGGGLAPGISLEMEDNDGMACLRPVDGRKMPALKTLDLLVGDGAYRSVRLADGAGIVLPRSVEEVREATSGESRFKLITATMRLIAEDIHLTTVIVDA